MPIGVYIRSPKQIEHLKEHMLSIRTGGYKLGASARLGKPLPETQRRNIAVGNTGKSKSKECREKISVSLTGIKRPNMVGALNPMHLHPNSYKSIRGKAFVREDLGLFLKSTWEANILRVFRSLGLNVDYEPRYFSLSGGRTYRPDFFIHETGEFVEVKGFWTEDARSRVDMFMKEYPKLHLDIIDPPVYQEYENEFKESIPNWEN